MDMIRFGPAGMGGVKEAAANLEEFGKKGLKACEIAFTYGVYIHESQKKEIEEIRKITEKYDIKLSIHAPYYVNLNSSEKAKVEATKKRILECCKIGELLGAYCVVFHPGYYNKGEDKEKTFSNVKERIKEMMEELKKKGGKIKLAPETMGKINVFGSLDEILRLVKETGCFMCIDFAHLKARSKGELGYSEVYQQLKSFDKLHIHFSGIEYGDKGEKKHIITPEKELRDFVSVLTTNKEIVVINESPNPVEDSVRALRLS